MTRSLVIAPQWIGDAVMTEPLMRVLAKRGETLTVAALPWVAPIYHAMPSVTKVMALPFQHGGLQWSERRAIGQSLAGDFDRAYLGPNSFKSALIPWFADIPERIGYHGEHRYGLLTTRLPNPSKHSRGSMVAHYMALAQEETLSSQCVPKLDLQLPVFRDALAELDLSPGTYVVLAPGAEYGPAKRWPAAHFAQWARLSGMPVVLLGSGKEAALCEDIAAVANESRPESAKSLAGKTNLTQAMAVIAAAHSVVSNDSGLMHVAAAFGVPQVALFGSSSPLHTPPLNSRASVLWLKNVPAYQPPLDCAPCFKRDCPLEHTRCLNDLSPQMVAQAWTHLVSG